MNVFAIWRVFLWFWASEANFLAVFSKRVRRFQEKLNIFRGKQELARTCTVCANTGGKHNRSKTSEPISDSAECYAGLSVRFESSAACM